MGLPSGFAIWFTGLPASGKSSLATELRRLLIAHEINAIILDSDQLRAVLTPRPQYSLAERDWLYSVIGYLVTWLTGNGMPVLIAATGHRRAYRDDVRARIPHFAEVYVRCSVEVCRTRDAKGLYRLAEQGQASSIPGLGVAYEPPLRPEIVIDTDQHTALEAAQTVFAWMAQQAGAWMPALPPVKGTAA